MSEYDYTAMTKIAMTAKPDPWPKPVPDDAPLVDRLRYRIEYGDLLASGDCDPQIYTVAEEALEVLSEVLKWATTCPPPDPAITNVAMIGHFAGFQRAREVVRGLLGIEEEQFWETVERESYTNRD